MHRFTFLFALSVMFLCSGAANAQATGLNERILPVYLVNDYMVIVRGSIGGVEKRNLLIDTGANPTVITPDLAKKLHLSGSTEQLQAVGHNMNSQVVSLPSLQVGPIQVQNLRVLVQDLTEFDKKLGLHLDGLVGLDVLAHSSFRIDYHAKKMIFGAVPPLPFAAPIRWTGYMACIDAHVDGHTVLLLLDSGAADIMLFSQRIGELADKPGTVWNNTGLAGHFTLRQVKLNSLDAAGSNLGPREVFVSDSKNAERYPYEGLLALGSQRFRQVGFDFEHQLFTWEPVKSRSNVPRTPRDSSLALASPAPDDAPSQASDRAAPAAFTAETGSR
jgi:predicted aspartyl protease